MKIRCDICGGELVMLAGGKGGACKVCGMEHSVERIREMIGLAATRDTDEIKPQKKEPLKKEHKAEILITDEYAPVCESTKEVLTESSDSDFVVKKRFGGTYELRGYTGNAQRVVFPAHNFEINNCSIFDGHDEIVELVISGGYSNTGCKKGIFAGLKNLKKVVCHGDMLAFDGDFMGCEKLEEVIIDNADLIQLNGAVFADCTSLKSVVLDENAELEMGVATFKNCASLKTFVHPKRSACFTSDGINSSAFEGCTSLEKVVLADDTTSIHKYAFRDCTNLREVTTHSGDLSGIAIHPEAFSGSSFEAENAGICPKCGKKTNFSDESISCSCGFSSVQYYN